MDPPFWLVPSLLISKSKPLAVLQRFEHLHQWLFHYAARRFSAYRVGMVPHAHMRCLPRHSSFQSAMRVLARAFLSIIHLSEVSVSYSYVFLNRLLVFLLEVINIFG